LVLVHVDALDDWPHDLQRAGHFILVLALDARPLSDETITAYGTRVLKQGVVCLCAWGPDCERVHDLFDDLRVDDQETDDRCLMTSWHADETLAEAIEYGLFPALASDYYETCHTVVVATVANHDWANEARRVLPRSARR